MIKKTSLFLVLILTSSIAKADKLESIFVAPDVFVTSKIKPTKDFEAERGNILFDGHDIEKKRKYSIGDMLKDLPGISSTGLGNASRPIIRGMANSRVKILQNSSSTTDVSEFGEDHIVGYDPMLIDKIEIINDEYIEYDLNEISQNIKLFPAQPSVAKNIDINNIDY